MNSTSKSFGKSIHCFVRVARNDREQRTGLEDVIYHVRNSVVDTDGVLMIAADKTSQR